MATVLIRTLIVYIFFVLALRLTGKRQIGELQISELVVTFMISELATAPIQDISIPIAYSVIPIVFLLAFEIIVSFLVTKSKLFKKLFAGNPSYIIRNGKLNQKELARLRIGVNELLGELRLKDVSDINDVDYAIAEQNGKISVFLKADKQVATIKDLGLTSKRVGLGHAVIIDGNIDYTNLGYAQKNEAWLSKELKSRKLKIENVFLMTVDDASDINIIIKEEKWRLLLLRYALLQFLRDW